MALPSALRAVVVVLQGGRLAAGAVDEVGHLVQRPLQRQVVDALHRPRPEQRLQQLQMLNPARWGFQALPQVVREGLLMCMWHANDA